MHGRKKPTREETPEERAEREKKVAKYGALFKASFSVCKARSMTPEAFKLNSKMLAANPDFYSMWNHRREMLGPMMHGKSDDEVAAVTEGELRLTQLCLADRNPKSYCAWFHRQWIVAKGHCSLEHELELCKKMLMADERNFHCWNYRRWVAERAGVAPQDELDFAKEKILYNFSNYSAWHYRSKLLPRLAPLTASTLASELEFMQDALFTEPADQSLWMYHRWLLSELAAAYQRDSSSRPLVEETMQTQLSQVVELSEAMEDDGESSKWPRLAEVYLLRLLASVRDEPGSAGSAKVKALYSKLAEMDPHHANFYAYAAASTSPMLGDLSASPPQPSPAVDATA